MVESLAIMLPLGALDVGCGNGITAVPLAQRGADVLDIDIANNLVQAGQRRAADLGLKNLVIRQGDACDLQGVANPSFDLALSMFGTMVAPRPSDVAKQLVRVTKPGGRIAMDDWIPGDPTSFVSQLLKISATFMPPPPEGFISPVIWVVEAQIVDRFGQAGVAPDRIAMVKDSDWFAAPDKSPADLIDRFKRYCGPTMNAFAAATMNSILVTCLVAPRSGSTTNCNRHAAPLLGTGDSGATGRCKSAATGCLRDASRRKATAATLMAPTCELAGIATPTAAVPG